MFTGTSNFSNEPALEEEAEEEVSVEYVGNSLEIGFNVTYLTDVLSNMTQDMVKMELSDGSSSALFTIPDNTSFKYVIMPMRI